MRPRSSRGGILPAAINYRGKRVRVWLGPAITGYMATVLAVGLIDTTLGQDRPISASEWRAVWVFLAMLAVFAAGLYDDFRSERTRGLVWQLRLATHGRITSGIVKLVLITMSSALAVWVLGGRGLRFALGTAVVAGSANLWNLLDVVPGRALKFFLPVIAPIAIGRSGTAGLLTHLALYAAIPALPLDLLEWGMLGDSGANVLGFVVGIGAFSILSTGWLILVLAGILALHALAETVTLSRLIEAAPPLRLFDRLGRRRADSAARG